jgi:hypothetical protein
VIRYETRGMDENAANEWFCTNGNGAKAHSVFERERPHIVANPPTPPFRFNHHHKCKNWKPGNAEKGEGKKGKDASKKDGISNSAEHEG